MFAAQRVAVIGASPEEGSVGYAITSNLNRGFDGEVVPVNPEYSEVMGLDCYPSITDVEGDVDLAVVVVPAGVALEVVEECGEAGVRDVVVITAGFGESGSEGSRRERRLREIAEEYSLRLVGPNSLGVMNSRSGLNATFGPRDALEGGISFMSQSGAFITAALDWASDNGVGFNHVVSLGNKAVLDETDFVEAWGDDSNTEVVLGYLEGVVDGQEFIETARRVTRDTPVVVVKSGRTEAGARAVSSHTGTLAGSEQAYVAGLDKAGVLRADTAEELFDLARVLESQPLPPSNGVAVVTNAGGPGVMATDAVGDSRLELAGFSDSTHHALRDALPEAANIYNPVDVLGDAPVERFQEAVETVMEDDGVGACVVIACPTAVMEFGELAEALSGEHDKPLVTCFMGGESTREAEGILGDGGVPNYFDPARGVRSLAALAEYREIREREYVEPREFDVNRGTVDEIMSDAAGRGENQLGVEALPILDAYGVHVPAGRIVEGPDDAVEAAAEIGGEVVMKIVSPDITHKSDIGGVKVGVEQGEVGDAFEDLVSRAGKYQPDARVLGVQVQESVDVDAGVETIVGVNRDPQFGPLVMFGLGGIFVEILEDTSYRVAPVSEKEARGMVREVKSWPLLTGARGRERVDVEGVVETIQRVSQLVMDYPGILELDVNPLVAGPDGVSAIDFRMTLDLEEDEQ